MAGGDAEVSSFYNFTKVLNFGKVDFHLEVRLQSISQNYVPNTDYPALVREARTKAPNHSSTISASIALAMTFGFISFALDFTEPQNKVKSIINISICNSNLTICCYKFIIVIFAFLLKRVNEPQK